MKKATASLSAKARRLFDGASFKGNPSGRFRLAVRVPEPEEYKADDDDDEKASESKNELVGRMSGKSRENERDFK